MVVNSREFVLDVLLIPNRICLVITSMPEDLVLQVLVVGIPAMVVVVPILADTVPAPAAGDTVTDRHHRDAMMIMMIAVLIGRRLEGVPQLMTTRLLAVVASMILIAAITLPLTLMSTVGMADLLHETTLLEITLHEMPAMLIMTVVATDEYSSTQYVLGNDKIGKALCMKVYEMIPY